MKYTSNYNLKKPDGTDVVNIEDFNGNADIIDTQLKTLKTAVDGKANTSHTHTKSQITDFPASLKNPTSLTVQFNGTTNKTYDGSTAQTVNITPSAIGAAASSHGTHVSYSTDAPKVAGTASAGTAGTVARTDHVHPAQTSVSGNAGTATKLATARTINGVAFDGTANITITDNTKVPTSTGNSITIHADSDSSSASEYAVLKAGGNELKVLSSAGGANPIKNNANLFFNGNKVYNAGSKPTKADVGLGNVDNTSDANKPISTAMQNALNGKANSSHTHTKSQITDMPTTLKNPNALTVQFNGVTNKTYDGGTAQTLNITPSAIGAAASSHNHSIITGGNANRFDLTAPNDCSGLSKQNNVDIKSWYGVSISNACGNAGVQGRPTVSFDARTGNAWFEGDIFVKGQSKGLFQSVSDGKSAIANAITGKGVSASANDDFTTLSNKIKQINTGYGVGSIIPANKIQPQISRGNAGIEGRYFGDSTDFRVVGFRNGFVYIFQSSGKILHKRTPLGETVWSRTLAGNLYGEIAFDVHDRLYFIAGYNLYAFDGYGNQRWVKTGIKEEYAVHVAPNNYVYYCSTTYKVARCDLDGNNTADVITIPPPYAGSIGSDLSGNIYVGCNIGGASLTKYNSSHAKLWTVNLATWGNCWKIKCDKDNYIYATGDDNIRKYDQNGNQLFNIGLESSGRGAGSIQLSAPDSGQELYSLSSAHGTNCYTLSGAKKWSFPSQSYSSSYDAIGVDDKHQINADGLSGANRLYMSLRGAGNDGTPGVYVFWVGKSVTGFKVL